MTDTQIDNNNQKINNVYTCSFCEKKEMGKPLSYLKNPIDREKVRLNGTNVALMPVGWDWDIVPRKFTDLFSCGCQKINRI